MMSKCGKGCLPECEYFTTGGCISPFNCAYKIEEYNQNTVFTNGDINNLSGIEKFFINTVKNGALPQEPMNYDGAAMKAYISYLENENERLRTENAKLKDKWDNLRCVYSYDGEVMEYCVNGPCPNDRRVSEVREENAELKARLESAVELHCNVGDIVYLIRQAIFKNPYKLEIEETKIEKVILTKTGLKVKFESNSFYETSIKNFNKTWFTDKKAAETRLAELKKGK